MKIPCPIDSSGVRSGVLEIEVVEARRLIPTSGNKDSPYVEINFGRQVRSRSLPSGHPHRVTLSGSVVCRKNTRRRCRGAHTRTGQIWTSSRAMMKVTRNTLVAVLLARACPEREVARSAVLYRSGSQSTTCQSRLRSRCATRTRRGLSGGSCNEHQHRRKDRSWTRGPSRRLDGCCLKLVSCIRTVKI